MLQRMSESTSYAIVGVGIIGLALVYRLTQRFPQAKVSLFEKELEIGKHQSGHNSGQWCPSRACTTSRGR